MPLMRRFLLPDGSVRDYSEEEYDLLPLPGISPADLVMRFGTQDILKWREVPFVPRHPLDYFNVPEPVIKDGIKFLPRLDEGCEYRLCAHNWLYVSEDETSFFIRMCGLLLSSGEEDTVVFHHFPRSETVAEMAPVLNRSCCARGPCSWIGYPRIVCDVDSGFDLKYPWCLSFCYRCAAQKWIRQDGFVGGEGEISVHRECEFTSQCEICNRRCSHYGGDYISLVWVRKMIAVDVDDESLDLDSRVWACNFCLLARRLPPCLNKCSLGWQESDFLPPDGGCYSPLPSVPLEDVHSFEGDQESE